MTQDELRKALATLTPEDRAGYDADFVKFGQALLKPDGDDGWKWLPLQDVIVKTEL